MQSADNLDRIIRRHLLSAALRLAVFAGLTFLFFTCVFGVEIIESNDMYPSVSPGDIVIYYRLGDLRRSDVVIYGDDRRIGRIQGMEPDVIDVTKDGELMMNGHVQPAQQERGIYYDTFRIDDGIEYPVRIDKGEYFILGDKRDTARDSRADGPAGLKDILGRVFIVIRRRTI